MDLDSGSYMRALENQYIERNRVSLHSLEAFLLFDGLILKSLLSVPINFVVLFLVSIFLIINSLDKLGNLLKLVIFICPSVSRNAFAPRLASSTERRMEVLRNTA